MKKTIYLCLSILLLSIMSACSSSTKVSLSAQDTTIELELKDGYTSNEITPFTISKDSKDVLKGSFINKFTYEQYIWEITKNPGSHVTLLKQDKTTAKEYIFYESKYDSGTEYIYIVYLPNSDVGIYLVNAISKQSAEDCFQNINFTIVTK